MLRRNPSNDPTALIALMIKHGLVKEEAVDCVLEKAKASGRKVGEVMVEMGLIDADQLDEALFRQQIARGQSNKSAVFDLLRKGKDLQDKLKTSVDGLHQAATARVATARAK